MSLEFKAWVEGFGGAYSGVNRLGGLGVEGLRGLAMRDLGLKV